MTFNMKTEVDGTSVTLTGLQFDNLYKHFEWNNDPELNRLDSELPYEKESLSEFKRRFEALIYHPSPYSRDFEIHVDGDKVIGVAYIAEISQHNKHCKIGITIGDRDYWGKGYGRAVLRLVLDYCFNELEMHRVSADTFEYNSAWRKLVVWAGFKREGTERDYLFRDGSYWDKETYAILEEEYRAHLPIAA